MAALTMSTSDSYQSLSGLTVECCICLEEKENDQCVMPECRHSWCRECEASLVKNRIKRCPMCKTVVKRVLRKGRWHLDTTVYGGRWVYEEGVEDSRRKRFIRKVQGVLSNLFLIPYPVGSIGV